MAQVTCTACGTVQQVTDPTAKTIACSSCKARIVVTAPQTDSDLPMPKRQPTARPAPEPARGTGDALLADLPAPKVVPPARPAAIGGRADLVDLPAPKLIPPTRPLTPPPMAPPTSRTPADLPAPKPRPPGLAAATVSGLPSGPRPGAAKPPTPGPPPVALPGAIELDDLLAPAGPSLPAPKPPSDLPAPKRPSDVSLPGPRPSAAPLDPPTVRGPRPDLPAPKGFFDDLPQPAAAARQAPDLPAPKGFFDDLPQPARQDRRPDLPAPKGFFDDLPQPARGGGSDVPAPKGMFDNLPQPARTPISDELAPKPPPAKPSAPEPTAPATKPPPTTRQPAAKPSPITLSPPPATAAPPPARPNNPSTPPTADELFDDLTPPPMYTTPPALDLDDLDLGPSTASASQSGLPRPGSGSQPGGTSVEPDPPPRAKSGSGILRSKKATSQPELEPLDSGVQMLDLGDADDTAAVSDRYGGLELPNPAAAPATASSSSGGGVTFKPADKRSGASHEPLALSGTAGDLELDETKLPADRTSRAEARAARKKRASELRAPADPASRRKTRIVLLVTLLVAALGAGGFVLYKKWSSSRALAAEVTSHVAAAKTAMLSPSGDRWQVALAAAHDALAIDADHADAVGIAAQANYAMIIDDGTAIEQRANAARVLIDRANSKALAGDEVAKATALKLLHDGQAVDAATRLDALAARLAADPDVALYQGWAKLAQRDHDAAIAAFDRAMKLLPARDKPALFGRAQARLGKGDLAGARADFVAVLAKDKMHVGAQVGLAAAAPATEIEQREKDLLVLLTSKDIDKADQRAVARGWTLAGDDARVGGRLDAARDRYRKAMQIAPLNASAPRGLAELELRENRLDLAAEAIDKALKLAPDNVGVQLVAAEIEIRRDKLSEAENRLAALRDRKLPITNPHDKSRLFVLIGNWRERQPGREQDALAAYEDAIALAGDADIDGRLAAASLLAKLAAKEKAPPAAAKLREQAEAKLAPLAAKAKADPKIAIRLGVAYLASNNPPSAESWLRQAIAARPGDIEAHFQLAEALERQDKPDAALAILRKAYELDDTRLDVGLELARSYENANRDADAAAMYDRLLAGKDVSIDLRGRAGRFFARIDKIDKVRIQSAEILKIAPEHAAGLFLEGKVAMADDKYEEARRRFQHAVDKDADPQYLIALGQANEALALETGDARYKDDAIRAYGTAHQAASDLFEPVAGLGRLHTERREAAKAVPYLEKAIALVPNDADVTYNMGLSLELLGRIDEATAWLAKALAVRPRAEGFYLVGKLYYDRDKLGPAATALASATRMADADESRSGKQVPWLTDAYYLLGRVQGDNHNDAAARKAWQQYLDRNPTDQVKVDQVKREMMRLRGG